QLDELRLELQAILSCAQLDIHRATDLIEHFATVQLSHLEGGEVLPFCSLSIPCERSEIWLEVWIAVELRRDGDGEMLQSLARFMSEQMVTQHNGAVVHVETGSLLPVHRRNLAG